MITRLLVLAVVLGLAALAITQAGPWLRGERTPSGSRSSVEGDGAAYRCVDLAFAANDRLSDGVRRFGQPPVDLDEWSDASWDVERSIEDAADACSCAEEACDTADLALDEMRQHLVDFDDLVRNTAAGTVNFARRKSRIFDLLNEARSQL